MEAHKKHKTVGRHQEVGTSVLCDSDLFAVYSKVLRRFGGVLALCSDVNKTTRFKTKAKTKTEGHKTKTKTIGPITKYSLQTVNEIIFYSTIFYNLCTLSTS